MDKSMPGAGIEPARSEGTRDFEGHEPPRTHPVAQAIASATDHDDAWTYAKNRTKRRTGLPAHARLLREMEADGWRSEGWPDAGRALAKAIRAERDDDDDDLAAVIEEHAHRVRPDAWRMDGKRVEFAELVWTHDIWHSRSLLAYTHLWWAMDADPEYDMALHRIGPDMISVQVDLMVADLILLEARGWPSRQSA